MIQRCTNPKAPMYRHYGGRGVTVDARWRGEGGFSRFFEDMGERPPGTSLDRKDNDRGYEPGNCRWATADEQQNNRSISVRVLYAGEVMTVAEAAVRSGFSQSRCYKKFARA